MIEGEFAGDDADGGGGRRCGWVAAAPARDAALYVAFKGTDRVRDVLLNLCCAD
eukprot:gene16907-59645_t